MSNRFSGKIALVSGSGRGLGYYMAQRLIADGARVVLHDVSEEAPAEFGESASLTDAARKVGAALSVTGDVADEAAVSTMRATIEAELGPVDLLVNAAGGDIAARGGKPNPNDGLGISMEDVRAMLDRNLIGTILMCKTFVTPMAERGNGCVVNIASSAAHLGVDNGVIYAVAKAGVVHYTRCLAAQLRPVGIRVNCISPGPTKTARFQATRVVDPNAMDEANKLARYGKPEEIADAVAFLLSDDARFVSGQVLKVDGAGGLWAG